MNLNRPADNLHRIHKKPRDLRMLLTAATAAGLVFAVACSSGKADNEPVVSVQATAVEKTTIEHTLATEAILFPHAQAAIVPKISAPVAKFLVKRGSRVHRGEVLAVLENRDLSAAAQDTKGAYEQAQAAYTTTTGASLPEEIQKAEADLQQAQQALDAQEKVFQSRQQLFDQGALPRKELDQSRVDVTQARNQYAIAKKHFESLNAITKQQELKAAEGQLQSAKGKYLGAEAQLSYSEIRSPIDGVITDRPLYPGEMATAGTPLLTVMDTAAVIAKAHVPQADAAAMKLGDKGTITAPGLEEPVEGKVTVVSPALDPNSTTVEVWVQAANPAQQLRPGMNAQVAITAQTVRNALLVPAAALLDAAEGQAHVMVVNGDGIAQQREVKTGIVNGDQAQVLSGLQQGEKVVSTGAYGLPDKTKVKAQPPEAAEKPSGAEHGADKDQKD